MFSVKFPHLEFAFQLLSFTSDITSCQFVVRTPRTRKHVKVLKDNRLDRFVAKENACQFAKMIEPAELTSELFDIPFIGRSPANSQPAIASFSAGVFCRQPALSDNPGLKLKI